ncbi:DUF4055 domain-containing protein [Vibrio parahaemolyticus]|nr:DUF4055 domain-containing protein [Vibrio parahaemolyticus]
MRIIKGGTEAVRAAGELFLAREAAEVPFEYKDPEGTHTRIIDPYKSRLKRTVLANFTERAVQNYVGKLFKQPVSLDSKREKALVDELALNIDGQGTSVTQLATEAAEDLLWQGCGGFLVDASVDNQRGGYALWVSPSRILGGKFRNGELVLLRIQEVIERDDGEWGTELIDAVKVFKKVGDKVTWAQYIKQKDDKGQNAQNGYVMDGKWNDHPLPVIPFIPVLAGGHKPCQLFEKSPLMSLAELNIAHLQKSSGLGDILHKSQHPILFIKGMPPGNSDKKPTIKTGVGNAVAVPDPSADMKYVEPSCNAISKAQEEIEKLEKQMEALGLEMLTKKGSETATGRSLDADVANSALGTLSDAIAQGLKKALKLLGDFNIANVSDVEVKLNKDFGLSMSSTDVSALHAARAAGDLSYETYMRELKRRNIVDESIDLDKNREELSKENAMPS